MVHNTDPGEGEKNDEMAYPPDVKFIEDSANSGTEGDGLTEKERSAMLRRILLKLDIR